MLELVTSTRRVLVVVAIETDGRWSEEAVQFIWQLASQSTRTLFLVQKVACAPRLLPRRWWDQRRGRCRARRAGIRRQWSTSFVMTLERAKCLCDWKM